MSTDNKLEQNQELEESKELSDGARNENILDNMKLSKTEYIQNTSENRQNSPAENQKVSMANQISQAQNIFPKDLAETQALPSSNIKNESNNNENDNLNEDKENHSLEKNESNQQTQERQKSQFIESQNIYEQQPNSKKSEFIESHHIYESNPDQIDKNASNIKPKNQEQIEEKKEADNLREQIKNVENQFNSLKISKTKYLTDEELSEVMKSNNKKNENNENKEEKQMQKSNPSGLLGQNDNVFSTNYVDNNNIQTTNIETDGIEGNNVQTNILGNNEFIKMSKTQYVQDDNYENINLNNNEIMQDPLKTKETYGKPNIVKVLKIEDEEQISICPDFISKLLRKIFG